MNRSHRMPFGTELQENGGVSFRLWAPQASSIYLSLEKMGGRKSSMPMNRHDGWFELQVEDAVPGDLYRFVMDDTLEVPDPASRYNPVDVHGPSQVINPNSFQWSDGDWRGRAWPEAVIYELHVGTFTPEGTFKGAMERLDYLAELGISAVELMPIADFPGSRNWGYDGVLPYAPDSSYGHPDDLKRLVEACHHRNLMVLLDVVYNHFGPEGNYLNSYAPSFFTDRHKTPWGNAINFDGPESGTVRAFFVHNALYWFEEFHFDGLRLDAVHSIIDESQPHILHEIAQAVRNGPGQDRFCHLVLENGSNLSRYLQHAADGSPLAYNAQWNDDWHHAIHVLVTGERDGYYSDYRDKPTWYLGRCLTEGFGYQGELSPYHENLPRGEPSSDLPLTAFVSFLQNHDQIGNRAFGERFCHLASPEILSAIVAILLLSPSPPMLFMGEEFGSRQPFLYFCDFEPELARAVSKGRREEFADFARFSGHGGQDSIPDPSAQDTYIRSKLDWKDLAEVQGKGIWREYRELISLRKHMLVPLLKKDPFAKSKFSLLGDRGLCVDWMMDGKRIQLLANLGPRPLNTPIRPQGKVLYWTGEFPNAWSVVWSLS